MTECGCGRNDSVWGGRNDGVGTVGMTVWGGNGLFSKYLPQLPRPALSIAGLALEKLGQV